MIKGIETIDTTIATRVVLDIDADEEGQYIIAKFRNTSNGHKHITMKPEFARALYTQLEEFVERNFPEVAELSLTGGRDE